MVDANGSALLADNGGPVQTIALRADNSNPALDAATGGYIVATDARGVAGFDQQDIDNGGLRDLGAFELDTQVPIEDPSLIVTTTADVVDQFDNLTSLREALALANTQDGADTITFDTGLQGTILLTQGELVISRCRHHRRRRRHHH